MDREAWRVATAWPHLPQLRTRISLSAGGGRRQAWGALTTELASFCKQPHLGLGWPCVCARRGHCGRPHPAHPTASPCCLLLPSLSSSLTTPALYMSPHYSSCFHPLYFPLPSAFSFCCLPGSIVCCCLGFVIISLSSMTPVLPSILVSHHILSPACFSILLHQHLAAPEGHPLSFCLLPSISELHSLSFSASPSGLPPSGPQALWPPLNLCF